MQLRLVSLLSGPIDPPGGVASEAEWNREDNTPCLFTYANERCDYSSQSWEKPSTAVHGRTQEKIADWAKSQASSKLRSSIIGYPRHYISYLFGQSSPIAFGPRPNDFEPFEERFCKQSFP